MLAWGLGLWAAGDEPFYCAVIRDLTERRTSRFFIENMLAAQDTERRRIARELHDETGQALTSLLVLLRTVSNTVGAEPARAPLDQCQQVVEKLVDQHRSRVATQ